MSGDRARRLLILAVALSLLVHLTVALIVRPSSPGAPNEVERVSIERRPMAIAVRRTPRPSPRPARPPPPPAPSRRASRIVKRAPVAAAGRGAGGTATAAPTAPATIVPTAGLACNRPNAPAAVAASPPPPEISPDVRAQGVSGTAVVTVELDKRGDVTGTSVSRSTGDQSLDLVAVGMARDARYLPAVRDCKAVAGAYAYSVKFIAW